MTFLAILFAAAIVLNIILAVFTILSLSDMRRLLDTHLEQDALWRGAVRKRLRRLEHRATATEKARRSP